MRRLIPSIALVLLVGNQLAAQPKASPDPWAGTRHLVLSKSTIRFGPTPRERTFVIESIDGGMKATVTGIEADGSKLSYSYTAKFDGKDYPVTGTRDVRSTSFRRIDAHTLESTAKKDGKVETVSKFVLSEDGKTLTLTQALPDGSPVNVLVYEK